MKQISSAATAQVDDMLREADHRIANQLSMAVGLIKHEITQFRAGPDLVRREAACEVLRDAAVKILGIARLHRHLAERPHTGAVDVGNLLIEIVRELVSSLSLQEQLLVTQKLSTACIVGDEEAQTISLLVVEIVMNAMKHAHPSGIPVEVRIACEPVADGAILLEISDDGVGLPEGFDTTRDGGLGFKLIRSLARKLDASLQIESDELGVSFQIQFMPQIRAGNGISMAR